MSENSAIMTDIEDLKAKIEAFKEHKENEINSENDQYEIGVVAGLGYALAFINNLQSNIEDE